MLSQMRNAGKSVGITSKPCLEASDGRELLPESTGGLRVRRQRENLVPVGSVQRVLWNS